MLHPHARALLNLMEERGIPPVHTLSPTDARALYRDRRQLTQPAPPEVSLVCDLSINGPHGPIALRLYRPFGAIADAILPVLVYFHGGGFVIGDLETHDTLCRMLSNRAGCAVVSVDYRLAPEHVFPCAVDDCLAATYWVLHNATAHKIDGSRLAVGGDSAGGNLAAVVSQIARDAGNLPIAFQLLINPITDGRRLAPSHKVNAQGYMLTADTLDYFTNNYIPDKSELTNLRASPQLNPNLTKLPPALILTAGYDPLRDEGLEYGQLLTNAGNKVAVINFPRQIHNFLMMGRVNAEADTAVSLCANELRSALNAQAD